MPLLAVALVAFLIGVAYFAGLLSQIGFPSSRAACQLHLVQTLPLPGAVGRIDHMATDTNSNRMFVAALGNDSVAVIDLQEGKVIHIIRGLSEPQGVVFVPRTGTLYVSNGGDGHVNSFDSSSYKLTWSVEFSSDADNIRFDSGLDELFVGYGQGGIGVVNASSGQIIATIPLVGHPESFQLASSENLIYVNIPASNYVAVINRTTNSVTYKWPIINASSNFAMALDEENHRLFIGTRTPAEVIVLDTKTGNVIARVAVPANPDDIYYDSSNGCIFVSSGLGSLGIIRQVDPDHYVSVGVLPTSLGARTSLLVPEQNRLYVAAPSSDTAPARILVFGLSGE